MARLCPCRYERMDRTRGAALYVAQSRSRSLSRWKKSTAPDRRDVSPKYRVDSRGGPACRCWDNPVRRREAQGSNSLAQRATSHVKMAVRDEGQEGRRKPFHLPREWRPLKNDARALSNTERGAP